MAKKMKKKSRTVYLEKEMDEKLEVMAEEGKRSVSSLIEIIIQHFVEASDEENKAKATQESQESKEE